MAPLMLFVIIIKFQFMFIHTQFSDKKDYFNHDDDALPEFLIDDALFINKNLDSKNPPWITDKTTTRKPVVTVKKSSKSTAPVTVTFDSKLNWVEIQPSNFIVISRNKNNDTNVVIPFSSSTSTIKITVESTTKAPTGPTARSNFKATYIAPSRTTTRSTTKPITKPTSIVTSTTRKVFTTTLPRYFTFSTENPFPVVPVWPKITTPRYSNSSIIENINKTNAEHIKTATGISSAPFYTVTATELSARTMKPITTATTKTPTDTPSVRPFSEANLNRIIPELYTNTLTSTNPTIPTEFRDLTLKRMGLRVESDGLENTDEINQTVNKPEAEYEDQNEKKKTTNILQGKEVIEYQLLETEPFSKFLEMLMKQLAAMDSAYAAKFLRTFERQLAVLMNSGRLDVLGPVTQTYIQDAMNRFHFPIDHKQRLLSMAHNILANRKDTLGPEMNSVLDYIDMLYSVKSEAHMQRILNETMAYPNISKTAEEITEGFLDDILLNPLGRVSGTTQGNKLMAAIADIITNKKPNLNARRVFIGTDNDFHKIHNKGSSNSHNYRNHGKRRRPKFVITTKDRKRLLKRPDEYGQVQTTPRNEEDKHRMKVVYRKNKEEINNLFNTVYSDEEKLSSISKNRGKTKFYSLKRGQEIHGKNVSKEIDRAYKNEKQFRAFYNTSYNNIRQNKMVNNPFRTLLYGKGRKDRFESSTEKETPPQVYFQRTKPTAKAIKQTEEFTTSEYKKIHYIFNKQSLKHESNIYDKQELKYNSEENKNKINNVVRESIRNEPNYKEDSEESDNDKEFTNTTILHWKKPKPIVEISSEKFVKIYESKSEINKDTETTKSEFKEVNISLKHFYFKPVIIQNKSGDSNEFVSIEFDGEPKMIDFSMKVKLKRPITYQTTQKATESPTTNALRVLNPYKMDDYFKNKSTEHDAKNDTADDMDSSSIYSDSSSIDDLGESKLPLAEEKGSQPQVIRKLRKLRNRGHKKDILRSKKHGGSKKHHHKRKHEKYKGHQSKHKRGKYGKKYKHRHLQAYLKKKSHDRKKRIKHKMKQLKGESIGDSDENNSIDATVVERARDGKRATISLVNKDKKLRSSESSITSKVEDTKIEAKTKYETSSKIKGIKYKSIPKVITTTTASPVATEDYFNLDDAIRNSNQDEKKNSEKYDPEFTKDSNSNSRQNEVKPSTKGNEELSLQPKDSRSLLIMANENRKRKTLSPMLIPIHKKNNANNREKAKSLGQMKNKIETEHRKFLPMQVVNDSDYSDEEDELKSNLYDAFRHKNEVYYRRNMRHELPLKDELKEESDITDEEVVLKQHIYKAIKEKNRRSYQ